MRGVFGQQAAKPPEPGRDTELTLGPASLLLLIFGLVFLCGLCFSLGYFLGHRGSPDSVATLPPASGGQAAPAIDTTRPKPSATVQAGASATQPGGPAGDNGATDSSTAQASAQNSAGGAVVGLPAGQPVVRPALPNAANPAQAAQAAQGSVEPALAPAGSIMVQIAAVSQQEDANVLIGALRKRGYAVTVHRDPLDGLLHVRVGPFKSRGEAETWRQRLLNDGYNAIVQP